MPEAEVNPGFLNGGYRESRPSDIIARGWYCDATSSSRRIAQLPRDVRAVLVQT